MARAGPGDGGVHYSFRISPLSPFGGVSNDPDAAGVDSAINEAGDTAVAIADIGRSGGALQEGRRRPRRRDDDRVGDQHAGVALAGDGTATVLWRTCRAATTR